MNVNDFFDFRPMKIIRDESEKMNGTLEGGGKSKKNVARL